MSVKKHRFQDGDVFFNNASNKRLSILLLALFVFSTIASFTVDILSFPLTEGWYWGFSQFVQHGVELKNTGFQLPYFGVSLMTQMASKGQIFEKLVSLGILIINFGLLTSILALISKSITFSVTLSSLFFSLHVLSPTYLFGDYHLFYILGVLLLLLAINIRFEFATPVAFLGLLLLASFKQNFFLAFLPFSAAFLSFEFSKSSKFLVKHNLPFSLTILFSTLFFLAFGVAALFVANLINGGFYYELLITGNGYSSKGSLPHILTRIYHDENNVQIIRHSFVTTFKISVLLIFALVGWITFKSHIQKIAYDFLNRATSIDFQLIKASIVALALCYGAVKAPMTQYLIVLTISVYLLLVVPLFLQTIEGRLRLSSSLFRQLMQLVLSKLKINSENIKTYNLVKLIIFGFILMGLNTTTSSFNFDGVGIATVLCAAIVYFFISAWIRQTAMVILALVIIPTIAVSLIQKIDFKYLWWDVDSPAFTSVEVFNAAGPNSKDFLLPKSTIELLKKIDPSNLTDRDSIVFVPHMAGLYKILDIRPKVTVPVFWYDITNQKINEREYRGIVSNFPERLLLWDNSIDTIKGHKELIGSNTRLMPHEVFLRSLACMVNRGLIKAKFLTYGENAGFVSNNFETHSALTNITDYDGPFLVMFDRTDDFLSDDASACWSQIMLNEEANEVMNFTTALYLKRVLKVHR